MNNNDPSLARRAGRNPFGKLTGDLGHLRVPSGTKEILEEMAAAADLDLADFVRLSLMIRAHGLEAVISVEQSRLELVAGIGSESGEAGA